MSSSFKKWHNRVDILTMNSIELAIQCNFPRFCGEERTAEAVEVFRAMKDELLKLRAKMEKIEWIKVKDRLPDELTPIIAYIEACEQGVGMAYMEQGKWMDGYSGRGITMIQQELVTHWMPFPEPPEEEQE